MRSFVAHDVQVMSGITFTTMYLAVSRLCIHFMLGLYMNLTRASSVSYHIFKMGNNVSMTVYGLNYSGISISACSLRYIATTYCKSYIKSINWRVHSTFTVTIICLQQGNLTPQSLCFYLILSPQILYLQLGLSDARARHLIAYMVEDE